MNRVMIVGMAIIRIEDARDARLADYTGVREPHLLVDRGLFIAEGRFVVRRLLTSRRLATRSLLVNDAALAYFDGELPALDESVDVFVTSPETMRAATGFQFHRGCLAVGVRPPVATLDDVIAGAAMVVVLERVVDPDNVGAVFRCAEAFGADAVLISPGCCDPFYRKAIRTSSGAALTVPFTQADPWPDALQHLRATGFHVLATTPDPRATAIGTFVQSAGAQGKVAVLFGTEGHGLTAEALALGDVRLRIPMTGAIDSLNLGTSAGIVLHRLHEMRTPCPFPVTSA